MHPERKQRPLRVVKLFKEELGAISRSTFTGITLGIISHANILSCQDSNQVFFFFLTILASAQKLDMESLLYKADVDESSLLHLAVDSGVVKVSWISE